MLSLADIGSLLLQEDETVKFSDRQTDGPTDDGLHAIRKAQLRFHDQQMTNKKCMYILQS